MSECEITYIEATERVLNRVISHAKNVKQAAEILELRSCLEGEIEYIQLGKSIKVAGVTLLGGRKATITDSELDGIRIYLQDRGE